MNYSEEDIKDILSRCSYHGLCAIYILSQSFKLKIAFHFDNTLDSVLQDSKDYCYGFIVAYASVNLVQYNYKNDILTMVEMNEHLAHNVVNELKARSKSFPDVQKTIKKIDDYFKE